MALIRRADHVWAFHYRSCHDSAFGTMVDEAATLGCIFSGCFLLVDAALGDHSYLASWNELPFCLADSRGTTWPLDFTFRAAWLRFRADCNDSWPDSIFVASAALDPSAL